MKLHEAADLVNEMAEEFKDSGGVPSSLLGMDDIALPDAATRMSEAVQMVDQFVYRLKRPRTNPTMTPDCPR